MTSARRVLLKVAWAGLAICSGLLVGGCGKSAEVDTVVKGEVIFPGDAPKYLMVRFHPADASRAPYDAALGPDRSFSLKCPKGSYRVTLAAPPAHAGAGNKTKTPDTDKGNAIPKKYRNPQTSWEVEVPEGGRNDLLLTVTE